MSLEEIVKKTVSAPIRGAKSLYESLIKPAAGYVKNVVLGYLPHTVRTMIGGNNYTARLIPDQQHTFKRNLQFSFLADLVGFAYGYSMILAGSALAGPIIAGVFTADFILNAGRYVANKVTKEHIRPGSGWLELQTPVLALSGAHAIYHVAKYGPRPKPTPD